MFSMRAAGIPVSPLMRTLLWMRRKWLILVLLKKLGTCFKKADEPREEEERGTLSPPMEEEEKKAGPMNG